MSESILARVLFVLVAAACVPWMLPPEQPGPGTVDWMVAL